MILLLITKPFIHSFENLYSAPKETYSEVLKKLVL